MDQCTLEVFEDGAVQFTPITAPEAGDQAEVDDLTVHTESNGCWVTLDWCKNPGNGIPQCTCKGCSWNACISNCKQLIKKTC